MKYELGQLIFYMMKNRVHSAPILSRMVVENAHDDWASTPEQVHTWQRFGESKVVYATIHGEISEEYCADSKEELFETLVRPKTVTA